MYAFVISVTTHTGICKSDWKPRNQIHKQESEWMVAVSVQQIKKKNFAHANDVIWFQYAAGEKKIEKNTF